MEELPNVRVARFDMCMFGLVSSSGIPMRKTTKVMTNSLEVFAALDGRCCDGSHEHQRIEGSESGQKRSTMAQVYPDSFVRAVCAAVLREVSQQ